MSNTIILDPTGRPADADKKIVHADAAGNITHDQEANESVQLHPYPDGLVLRHMEHPVKKGMRVLRTGNGAVVAMTLNLGVAEFLCQAAALMVHAIREEQARAQATEQAEKLDEAFSEAAAASVISGAPSPALDPVQNPAVSGANIS